MNPSASRRTYVPDFARIALLACVSLLLCILFGAGSASAAPVASRRAVAFLPGDGLAGDVVRSVVRTPGGDIWFACWGRGVSRYDGYAWKNYGQNEGLPTLDVRALAVDHEGRLWCGTTAGIARFDGEGWQQVSTGLDGLENPTVYTIAPAENGDLWFGVGEAQLLCFTPHNRDKSYAPRPARDAPGGDWSLALDAADRGGGQVKSILPDVGGEVWAALDEIGVLRRIGNEWRLERDASLPGNIIAMAQSESGDVWVGGLGFIAHYMHGERSIIPLDGEVLTCLSAAGDRLYVGTNEGLRCYDGNSWKSDFVGEAPTSVPILSLTSLDPDDVWVGTRYGAYRITSNEWTYSMPANASAFVGPCLYTDAETAPLLMDDRGALHEWRDERWDLVATVEGAAGPCLGMTAPRHGVLWALFPNGLYQIALRDQVVTATLDVPAVEGTIKVYCGPSGRVFVYGARELFERVDGQWKLVRAYSVEQPLLSVIETGSGALWLGQSDQFEQVRDGISTVDPHAPGAMESVAETRAGALLVGVAGHGVFEIDGGALKPLVSFDGASSKQTNTIFQARDGTIFVGNRQVGLSSYNDGFWTTHLESNGVPPGRVLFIGQDPKGNIWAQIQRAGIIRYRPSTAVAMAHINVAPHTVAYKESALFQFSATDMWRTTPEKDLRYSWRVLSQDSAAVVRDWSRFSASQTVVVTPLRPGAYEFQVIAMNRGRTMGQPSALAAFSVAGPFWAQAGFYVPVGALALVVAALGWYSFRKHVSLGKAEARYRGILNSISEAVFSLTPDGTVTYVSPAFDSILGLQPERLLGSPLPEQMEPADGERFRAWLATVDHDEVTKEEYQFAGRSGALRWLRLSCHVVFRDGHAVNIHGVGTDITELKSAEDSLKATLENQDRLIALRTREVNETNTLLTQEIEVRLHVENALRQSEEQLRLIIERCPLAMVISDDAGNVEYANSQFVQIFGFIQDEIPNLDEWWKRAAPDNGAAARGTAAWKNPWDESGPPQGGGILQEEARLISKQGDTRIVETRCTRIASRWLLILNDVTERRGVEERERLHREQVLQAGKLMALGTLVSGVAHEINNPNHIALLAVSTLDRVWKDVQALLEGIGLDEDSVFGGLYWSEVREQLPVSLSRLKHSSERIGAIVRDLRTYAVPQAEHVKEAIDIGEVARSAAAWMGPLVAESTRSFCLDCAEPLPPILGNRRRLEQVMVNLIQNACQALLSSDGEVRVSTSFDRASGRVVVEVADSGQGMDDEVVKHVMDPFFTTKRSEGGTGLGLSISSTIVREHGGELSFSSRVGKGTVARITFPAHEPAL